MGYMTRGLKTTDGSWQSSPENLVPAHIDNSLKPNLVASLRHLKNLRAKLDLIRDEEMFYAESLLEKHEANLGKLLTLLGKLHAYAVKERKKVAPRQKKEKQETE